MFMLLKILVIIKCYFLRNVDNIIDYLIIKPQTFVPCRGTCLSNAWILVLRGRSVSICLVKMNRLIYSTIKVSLDKSICKMNSFICNCSFSF